VRVSLVSEEIRVALDSEDDVRSPEAEVPLAVKEPEATSEVALDSEDDVISPEAETSLAVAELEVMSQVVVNSREAAKVVSASLVAEPEVVPEPALDSRDEVEAASDLLVTEPVVVSEAALRSADEAETISVVVGFTVVRLVVVVSEAIVADLAPTASVKAVSASGSVDVEASYSVTAVDEEWVSPSAELSDVSEASPDEVPEVSVISMIDEVSDDETLPMIELVSDLDADDVVSEDAVSETTVVPWEEVPLAVKFGAPIPPWGCLGLHGDDLLTSGLTWGVNDDPSSEEPP
jgi:hypothetical protein